MLSVSAEVSVDGTVACTDMTQKFINPSDVLVPEARHSFPLYRGAVVTSFDCIVGDKRYLHGCVKPAGLANDDFNRAKTSGKRQAAALLEEVTPEMFETALGNIPPHTIVTVKLRCVHELETVVMKDEKAEGLAITIPSSIAPYYRGLNGHASHRDPSPVEEGLKIEIRVANNGIINVESCRIESGHDAYYQGTQPMPRPVVIGDLVEATKLQADTAETPRTQSVWRYTSASPVLKKDFVLVVQMRPEYPLRSRAVIEPIDSKGLAAMMVSLRPTDLFGSAVRPQAFMGEILFLLDRSGSMKGAAGPESTRKIDTMRDAMKLALAGLPDTCVFNIISFGGEVRGMWPQSRSASDSRSIDDARVYVSHIEADMGGTEVLQVLKAATTNRLQSQVSTQVILITDGEVYEPQNPILKFVRETRRQLGDKIRFFTLGIGDRVSHHIMESIAELGGGYCDVVDVAKRPYWEDRLNRLLRSAMEPNSWSCEIALGPGYHCQSLATTRFAVPESDTSSNQRASVPYVQAPDPVPLLQPYRYKSLFFLLDLRGGSAPLSVTVTTTTPGAKRKEYKLEVEETSFNTRTIHHLAAKTVLVALEKEVNKEAVEADMDTLRANAEYLGTEYTIASKWTSFVAVEGDPKEQAQEVKVDMYSAPLRSTSEHSSSSNNDPKPKGRGHSPEGHASDPILKASQSNCRRIAIYPENMQYDSSSVSRQWKSLSSVHGFIKGMIAAEHEEEHASITWRTAVRCQRDGLFVLDEALRMNLRAHFCASATVRLDKQIRQLSRPHMLADGDMAAVVDTLMIMSYFETHLAAERNSWDLLIGKAERRVLLLLGFKEDDDEVLAPLHEMLTRSIAHVHFNEAVYSASVERQSGNEKGPRRVTVKTCPVCDVDFDAEAWPECGGKVFVCCNDDCYNELPGGRKEFDNWDLFWKHEVESGHLCCPV
ncbi:von Willebrand factor type A domain-containing protein [Xylaria intraflava]|nr:von Willebrand factor type A domain-containing protein [Xylaria intraflava]